MFSKLQLVGYFLATGGLDHSVDTMQREIFIKIKIIIFTRLLDIGSDLLQFPL